MTDYKLVTNSIVDELAQFIREVDGNNRMGAGALAEKICERFLVNAPDVQVEPEMSTTQALIALGKVIAGYRPGEEGWTKYDQQAYDVAMSTPQPLSESDIPAEQQPSVQKPVGFVSQDFLEGKWSLDHISKSDEGQISRTIPVFAKPPQPGKQSALDVNSHQICETHQPISTPCCPVCLIHDRDRHRDGLLAALERAAKAESDVAGLVDALELAQGFLRNKGYSEEDTLLLGAINAALAPYCKQRGGE